MPSNESRSYAANGELPRPASDSDSQEGKPPRLHGATALSTVGRESEHRQYQFLTGHSMMLPLGSGLFFLAGGIMKVICSSLCAAPLSRERFRSLARFDRSRQRSDTSGVGGEADMGRR
jgi:hypothetical protein